MNERIKQLAGQANIHFSRVGILDGDPNGSARMVGYSKMEKFAELIVKECKRQNLHTACTFGLDANPFIDGITAHFGVEE
jgi:hypothetical protein